MDNQVTIFGCPSKFFGCPYLEYMYKGDFWLQIYGCLSDNCISIFSCPTTFLVVPGARTTKISNVGDQVCRRLSAYRVTLCEGMIVHTNTFTMLKHCVVSAHIYRVLSIVHLIIFGTLRKFLF